MGSDITTYSSHVFLMHDVWTLSLPGLTWFSHQLMRKEFLSHDGGEENKTQRGVVIFSMSYSQ